MIVGEYYDVPCLYRYREINSSEYVDEQVLWMDLDNNLYKSSVIKEYIPVLNHPHNDVENGQVEIHYHADDRFYIDHIYDFRPRITGYVGIEYKRLQCLKELPYVTPIGFISQSKFKHKCIYKGKCPHRGFDLSQETPINGVITCPLHGLQFNSLTKEIINAI